jgi:hypothetical protein
MKRNWIRDAFCALFLTLALWNLAQHILNLNGDRWQQAAQTVIREK